MKRRERIILDLCGGTGSWSRPYLEAGYDVRLVTLPAHDVRVFIPPPRVWGVLCAPPCTEFSLGRNAHPKDRPNFVKGMSCVNACLRIVFQTRPLWWALENPDGHLRKWLGLPRMVYQPWQFGCPYSKKTALWGKFVKPRPRNETVPYCGSVTDTERNPQRRAITPPEFARAFFEVND